MSREKQITLNKDNISLFTLYAQAKWGLIKKGEYEDWFWKFEKEKNKYKKKIK